MGVMSEEQITGILDQILTVTEISALERALETRIDKLRLVGGAPDDEGIRAIARTARKLGLTIRPEWLTDGELAEAAKG